MMADLALSALLVAFGILCIAINAPLPARIAVWVPVLLFVPGYLLTLALYPRDGELSAEARIGLSLASSAAMVGLVSLSLSLHPLRFAAITVAAGVALLIGVLIAISYGRRIRVVSRGDKAFSPTALLDEWRRDEWRRRPSGRRWSPARLFFIGMVLLSLGAVGMGAVVPPLHERFTELIVHDAAQGPGEANQTLIVEVRNHERTPTTYTLEAFLTNQTLDPTTSQSSISGMRLLSTSVISIDDSSPSNVTLTVPLHDASVNRLEILLFRGEVPSPSQADGQRIGESYRNASIWLKDVASPSG